MAGTPQAQHTYCGSTLPLRSTKKSSRRIWALQSSTVKAQRRDSGGCPTTYVQAGISWVKYFRRQSWPVLQAAVNLAEVKFHSCTVPALLTASSAFSPCEAQHPSSVRSPSYSTQHMNSMGMPQLLWQCTAWQGCNEHPNTRDGGEARGAAFLLPSA